MAEWDHWGSYEDAERDLRAALDGVHEKFDHSAFVAEVVESRPGGGYQVRDAYQDDEAFWDLVRTLDARAEEAAESDREARAAAVEQFRQDLEAAARRFDGLQIGEIRIGINTEFREGGLVRWPTSPHFWVTLTDPDGDTTRVGADLGSWDALLAAVEEANDAWAVTLQARRRDAERRLERVGAAWRAAEQAEKDARAARDEAIKEIVGAKLLTAYRAAKIVGITPARAGQLAAP